MEGEKPEMEREGESCFGEVREWGGKSKVKDTPGKPQQNNNKERTAGRLGVADFLLARVSPFMGFALLNQPHAPNGNEERVGLYSRAFLSICLCIALCLGRTLVCAVCHT